MKSQYIKISRVLISLLFIVFITSSCQNKSFYYLQDAPVFDNAKNIAGHPGYPKINHSETKAELDVESLRKYSEVSSTSANALPHYVKVKELSPEVLIIRKFHPLNTIAHSSGNFFTTGPVTNWPEVFAGHWAYKRGVFLDDAIGKSSTALSLSTCNGMTPGKYIVIYDAPAGSFKNAEHAEIIAVDTVNNILTVKRGYKSETYNHKAGSVVAEHHIQANGVTNWTYNFSTTCPKDASGKILAESRADWIASNYYKTLDGVAVDKNLVDGVMLDAFSYYRKNGVDADNDLIVDDGVFGEDQAWINGMNIFYERVRKQMPDKLFIGGGPNSWGFEWLNGTQMEVWPVGFRDGKTPGEAWQSQLAKMNVYMNYSFEPYYSEGLDRMRTEIYPFVGADKHVSFIEPENRYFRFGFALALITGSYYGKENFRSYPDIWYDEYGVVVDVPVSDPDFGRAIENTPENQSRIRDTRAWMGEPLGSYKRLYNASEFKPSKSLIANGSFINGIDDWTGSGLQRIMEGVDGSAALSSNSVSNPEAVYSSDLELAPGDYTLCFAVKASEMSRMNIVLNGNKKEFISTPKWERSVFTFKIDRTSELNLTFNQFEFGKSFLLDDVFLFKGNADVLQREFENALIIFNGTNQSQEISVESKTHGYKRIKGTQDSLVNNGEFVSTVTIPAHDAAILVKYRKQ